MTQGIQRAISLRNTARSRNFGAIDAMRGLAALAVVAFHAPDLFGRFIPKAGWLSVDLFFCLSGFVISHAYGARLNAGLTLSQFIRIRLIRLYPLYLLSLLFGAGLTLLGAMFGNGGTERLLSLPLALIFLPMPFAGNLYPLNLPAWSLFMELLVNVIAALVWKDLSTRALSAIITLNALALSLLAYFYGTANGGGTWSAFPLGLARVGFSFFAGVGVYRLGYERLPRVSTSLLLLILAATLVVASSLSLGWQLLIMLFGFPALVALGARSNVGIGRYYELAGRLSYGVYVLHGMCLTSFVVLQKKFVFLHLTPFCNLIVIVWIIGICWLADTYWDQPIRRKLIVRSRFSAEPEQAAL